MSNCIYLSFYIVSNAGDLSGLNESEGRNNAEEKEMTYEDRGTVSLLGWKLVNLV